MNFYVKVVLAVVVLIVAALAAMFLFTSSDEEAIRELIQTGVTAARKGDADTVIGLVSKENWEGEKGYDETVKLIRVTCEDQRVRAAQLAGEDIAVHGDEAEATFTVQGRIGPHDLGEVQVRIKLKREEDGWKVVDAERLR